MLDAMHITACNISIIAVKLRSGSFIAITASELKIVKERLPNELI